MTRLTCASLLTAVLALTATACGEEAVSPTNTTLPPVGAPNYATLAPVPPSTSTTTLAPGETLPPDAPGSRSTRTQTYEVEPNDGLSAIAEDFDVTINELCDANGWDDCPGQLIIPGQEVVIPVGAFVPDPSSDETIPLDDPLTASVPSADTPCSDGSERQTYEITADDISQSRAASQIGVDLELLAWVNRTNPAWTSFVPGQELIVPCADEELPEAGDTIALDPDDTSV